MKNKQYWEQLLIEMGVEEKYLDVLVIKCEEKQKNYQTFQTDEEIAETVLNMWRVG